MATNYKDIPKNYPLCMHTDCPKAETCLHQLAFRQHAKLSTYLKLINPAQCTRQANCPHYADYKPVIFAKGFTNFQKQMFPGQYDKFMSRLILHFGRNAYYLRRRGDILLPPDEQEFIKATLKRSGITTQMEFDEYIEGINWK